MIVIIMMKHFPLTLQGRLKLLRYVLTHQKKQKTKQKVNVVLCAVEIVVES